MKFLWNTNQIVDYGNQIAEENKNNVLSARNDFSSYEGQLDDDLYNLLQNNPYKDLYYEPTTWDYIGLSNKSKDANLQYEQLYNEYIANILAQQSERNWNSPANEAMLERQAGLNPDLTGISGSSQSDIPEFVGASPSALTGQSPAVGAVQGLGSLLSFALNAYQGISSTIANVKSIDLSNVDKLSSLARPFVTDSFANAFLSDSDLNSAVNFERSKFVKTLPRSLRKQGIRAFDSLLNNLEIQSNAFDRFSKRFDSEINADMRDYFSKHNETNTITRFIKDYVDLNLEAVKLSRRNDISHFKKNKWLNDFRLSQLEHYKKEMNNGNLLAGLMLVGMLESQSVPIVGNMANTALKGGVDIIKNFTNPLSWVLKSRKK